jgi:hypothetical protein
MPLDFARTLPSICFDAIHLKKIERHTAFLRAEYWQFCEHKLDSGGNSAYTTEFLDGPGRHLEGRDSYG